MTRVDPAAAAAYTSSVGIVPALKTKVHAVTRDGA